jgi:hypothetical protein
VKTDPAPKDALPVKTDPTMKDALPAKTDPAAAGKNLKALLLANAKPWDGRSKCRKTIQLLPQLHQAANKTLLLSGIIAFMKRASGPPDALFQGAGTGVVSM